MSKRVLIYSIYGRWLTHTYLEGALLHTLRGAGAEVRFIACDGAFPACEIYRSNMNPRHKLSCQDCQTETFELLRDLRVDWEGFGSYIDRARRHEAKAFIDAIPAHQLFDAVWKGQPIGEWGKSSALTHYRMYAPDWEDAAFVAITRAVLVATILSYEGCVALFDEFQPDVIFLMNGRFYPHRVAIEVATQRGVRFITHERGRQEGNYRVVDGASIHALSDYDRLWEIWKDISLTTEELGRIQALFGQRRQGKNLNWEPFSPPPSDEGKVRQALSLDARPLITCFTSSDDEVATMPEWSEGAFPFSLDWIPATVAFARERPDLMVVIRAHPNLGRQGGNKAALAQLELIAADLPENCRVVRPKDDISSYTLLDMSDVVVVYCSTMGLEGAVAGKPVVTVARGTYGEAEWVTFCRRPEDYAASIDAARARGPSREIARLALRQAHVQFETMHFHLALRIQRVAGQPATLDAMMPRHVKGPLRNPLGLVTGLILEGTSHHRQVTPADRARSRADEDAFLLNRLPQLCPETGPLFAAIAEASGHLSRRDPRTALTVLLQSAQREPRFVLTWLKLAEAFTAAGSREGARDAWERALAIDPFCREARVALLEHGMATRARALVERHHEQLIYHLPGDALGARVQDWLQKQPGPSPAAQA